MTDGSSEGSEEWVRAELDSLTPIVQSEHLSADAQVLVDFYMEMPEWQASELMEGQCEIGIGDLTYSIRTVGDTPLGLAMELTDEIGDVTPYLLCSIVYFDGDLSDLPKEIKSELEIRDFSAVSSFVVIESVKPLIVARGGICRDSHIILRRYYEPDAISDELIAREIPKLNLLATPLFVGDERIGVVLAESEGSLMVDSIRWAQLTREDGVVVNLGVKPTS